MRGNKFKYYLVIILASLSLTSVGFASWIVSDTITESTSGLIIVEDVLKANDFITCSSEDITKFGFYKNGFLDADSNILTTGNVNALFTIDLDECKNEFKDCNTVAVEINMSQDNLYLFNSTKLSMTIEVKQGESIISSRTTYNNSLSVTSFSLPITSGSVEVQITYIFEINDLEYFRNTIYPILLNEDFNFVLSAKLTGEKVAS